MKSIKLIIVTYFLSVAIHLFAQNRNELPHTFIAKPQIIKKAKERITANDSALQSELIALLANADAALSLKAPSVMNKKQTLPSRDKRDFMCPAPLWWPDAEQKTGLPYVWNREGNINPEYFEVGDQSAFEQMADAVQHLTLAFYFTDEEKYAKHASHLLRVWFIDAETGMNPNLNHAWFERGRNDGTPFGIKSMEKLPFVIDAIGLISASNSWTEKDQAAMTSWVDSYLNWLRTSQLGQDARMIWNRFGTVYDVQAVSCALFLGKTELARDIIEASKNERINRHIRRDGRQPYELEREITFMNSVEGVGYFFQLATLAERIDIDLWNYRAREGGSIRRALDFVAPYADSTKVWPYILEVKRELLRPVLQQAAVAYDDDAYLRLLKKLSSEKSNAPPVYSFYIAGRDDRAVQKKTRLFIF